MNMSDICPHYTPQNISFNIGSNTVYNDECLKCYDNRVNIII